MFTAVREVIKAGYLNYKVNCDSFFIACDFRALANYKRTYSDLISALNDKSRLMAQRLHEYAVERKIMPVNCNYFYRVEYKLKGKIVFILDLIDNNTFKINIGFAHLNSVAFNFISDEIEKYDDPDDFKRFCLKHFAKYCKNCNPACTNKTKPREAVFGKKIIICADNPFIRILNPESGDIEYLLRLIDLRAAVINNNISEPFYPGNG
jgi:hypothetical protein